ncbi:hypothetical protein ACWGDT_18670 [Streptomyces avermitilis]
MARIGPRQPATTVVALGGGSFEADDHAFRIDQVEVDTAFDKQPTAAFDKQPPEPVATFVDGPTSTTAAEKENGVSLLPGATGPVCLLAGAWNIRSTTDRPREALVAAPA